MKRTILWLELLLIALSFASTGTMYSRLPNSVATHWNSSLHADGYSPRWVVFLLGPGLLTTILLFTYLGPWLSPSKFEVASFQSTYEQMMLMLFCAIAYCSGVILWAGTGHPIDSGRAIQGGLCVLFVFSGNLMGKVRRNFFLGIKTPWALASERVWNATHRLAAKTFVVSGLIGLVCTMLDVRVWPMYAVLAGVLVPAVYSLVIYKQLEGRGEV